MFPYNEKLFRRKPAEMTADWVSWAVPRPSLEQVVRGALGLVNRGMGYNPTFRYPERGGIDVLPLALADRVEHMRLRERVVEVDVDRRRVELHGGGIIDYDALVVTTPLPDFLRMVRGGPSGLDRFVDRLDWSVVACLNLGIDRPEIADGAHWMYFPDRDAPFYRAGFPTNFSAAVAPPGTSSIYVEFGLGRGEAFDPVQLESDALEVWRRGGILADADRVLVRDWVRIDPGYVIFDRARQDVMARVGPELERRDVHLVGRYGAWTYSYMERALLDGLELAAKIRAGHRQRA
jgi:protoporphyrinogen oxidase